MQTPIDGIRTYVIVNGREYPRAPRVWLNSVRHAPLCRAGLTLPDPDGTEMRRLAAGQAVELHMGYRGVEPAVWKGTVEWVRPGTTDQVEIGTVGPEAILARTRITQAYLEETPEAILRHALRATGLPLGKIDAPGVVLPRFAASNETIWALAEKLELSCMQAFGLDMSRWTLWVDGAGNACWGDFDDPSQTVIPGIASGSNLIEHAPATDAAALGMVETFLMPGLMHSQCFRLRDIRRGVDDIFRALRVWHETSGTSARTFVWYGEEHGQY